jgi:bacteriocin-like protein
MSDTLKNSATIDSQQADKAKAPNEANQLSTDELASVTGGKMMPPSGASEGGGYVPRAGINPRNV